MKEILREIHAWRREGEPVVVATRALCRAARLLGWRTVVADPRARFATAERIPSADELLVARPDDAFARVAPDPATAVVVLTHDDEFDVPALKGALASEAFDVGALGSRRNQERRRERPLDAGVDEAEVACIAGAVPGLYSGAASNEETAVSTLAEALAVRAGRGGGALRDSTQQVHVKVA